VYENNIGDGQAGDFIYMWGQYNVVRGNIQRNCLETGGYDFAQTFGASGYYSHHIIFEGNKQYNTGMFQVLANVSYDSQSGQHDWTFRNNIIWNVAGQGNFGIPNLRFYNNLVYASNYYNTNHVFAFLCGGGDWYCPNAIVKNNVFIGNGNNSSNGWYTVGSDTGFTADYNYIARTPNFQAYTSFDTPFVAGGREAHGVNGGAPKFVDFANKNFHLTSASTVLIGKGENLSGTPDAAVLIGANNESYTSWTRFNTDFDWKTRPSGAWAIGPYEYGGGDAQAPQAPKNLIIIPQ
jgi:hypothetical protein